MIKTLLTSAAALAVSASLAFAAPEIGKPAPDFTAKDTNGKEITLSKLQGKIVVLEWTNPGCPFVRKFYDHGDMQAMQDIYTQKGVLWVRVNSSAEGKEGHQNAAEANTLAKKQSTHATATILDPKGEIGHLYEAKTTPHLFVIDTKGVLAYMGAVDNVPSPDSADIAKADNHLTDAIEDVLKGKEVRTPVSQPYGCGVKYAD